MRRIWLLLLVALAACGRGGGASGDPSVGEVSKITDGASAVQYIAFTSDTLSIPQITDFATRVAQPLFTSIPGVASADLFGAQALAMRVWIDPVKLAARGMTAGDIAAALRANNVQAAPGQLKGEATATNITATTDVTDIEGAAVGDEVVLLGRQGQEEIAAEEMAEKLDTISYEVFCGVGARVPRVFMDGSSAVGIRSRFHS